MTVCEQHHEITVERRIIRGDGRAHKGDGNRLAAYWSLDEQMMERVLNGCGLIGRDGPLPRAPEVRIAAPSERYMAMTRGDLVAQQALLVHAPPESPLRADDLGWLLAHGRKQTPAALARLHQLGHPLAANVATLKGRDLETIALTASTTPTMFGAWGTNPASLTAASSDVAAFAERVGSEARTSVGPTQVTGTTVNDTWQYQFTISATGTVTIAEVVLFSASTQPAQAAVAAGGVVASGASTTLNTAATFTPVNNNYIQIRTEVMQVTAGSGTTALTVVRMNNIAANLGGGAGNISTIAVSDNVGPGNPPGQTGIVGGSGLIHADHTGDGLASGDSIQYTIKDRLT